MCAFVVLGLVFHTKPRDWLGERLRNDLFCVEWDIKLQLSQLNRDSVEMNLGVSYLGQRSFYSKVIV